MAKWTSASLSNLLPGAVETIFDAIDALVTVVKTPLDAVKSALNLASVFLVSLNPFDFISALKLLVDDFRKNILGGGYYLLDMWDYPAKQLMPSTYSPDSTFDALRLSGDTFQSSFQADLLASFDDLDDTSRPQFTGKCAILIIVAGRGTIDDIGIMPEEDNVGRAWRGLDAAINHAGNKVRDIRIRAAMAQIRLAAESQPQDKVAQRVERTQRAFRLLSFMSTDDLDLIPTPMDPATGESFFENTDPTSLSWEDEVAPILETIETFFEPHEYPDWERATLYEIYPDLAVILDVVFDAVLDLLGEGGTILKAIKDLINAIQAKLDELDRIIELIDELEEQIEALLNATGFHVLYVTSDNGIADLKSKIQSATDLPFTSTGFYAGMAIMVGGGDVPAFDTIFGVIAAAGGSTFAEREGPY